MSLIPPTIHELLDDPVYRRYVKRRPSLPVNVQHGTPWAFWVRTKPVGEQAGKWRGTKTETYDEAWGLLVKAFRANEKYADAVVVSRRVFFAPPEGFTWDVGYDWCGRCRRPSTFRERFSHHALRDAPCVTTEDAYRCYFCGVRRIILPAYDRH